MKKDLKVTPTPVAHGLSRMRLRWKVKIKSGGEKKKKNIYISDRKLKTVVVVIPWVRYADRSLSSIYVAHFTSHLMSLRTRVRISLGTFFYKGFTLGWVTDESFTPLAQCLIGNTFTW